MGLIALPSRTIIQPRAPAGINTRNPLGAKVLACVNMIPGALSPGGGGYTPTGTIIQRSSGLLKGHRINAHTTYEDWVLRSVPTPPAVTAYCLSVIETATDAGGGDGTRLTEFQNSTSSRGVSIKVTSAGSTNIIAEWQYAAGGRSATVSTPGIGIPLHIFSWNAGVPASDAADYCYLEINGGTIAQSGSTNLGPTGGIAHNRLRRGVTSYTGSTGDYTTYLSILFAGVLTKAERDELRRNPWQIFSPSVGYGLYGFDAGGGSGTTLTTTTSLNAAIQQAKSATASVNGAVQQAKNASASVNTAIQQAFTASANLEAAVQASHTASSSINGYIQAGSTVSANLSAAILQVRSAVSSLDAGISASHTASVSANGAISQSHTTTVSLSGAVLQARSATASLGAALMQARSATADLSGYVLANTQVSATLNAAIQATRTASASLNGYIDTAALLSAADLAAIDALIVARIPDIAAAVGARTVEGIQSADAILRILLAAVAGKRVGLGSETEEYMAQDGTTPRITFSPTDAAGNGTPVVNGS